MDGAKVMAARISAKSGAALSKLVADAVAKIDPAGMEVYQGSYVDLVLAAESERGTVTLVAGSHTQHFPYFGTEPWDNCLLLVGDTGYTFTGRTQGASLHFEFDVEQPTVEGTLRFDGEMLRASDGEPVAITLELPITLAQFPTRLLGQTYNFLKVDDLIGIKWNPYALRSEGGTLRVGGEEIALSRIGGACERGVLTNLKAREFAGKYEYVAVARPGDGGYGIIHFTSHALYDDSPIGNTIDWYLRRTASALLTIEDGKLTDGNTHGVYSPPQDDPQVVLFENEVDLGPAVLKRQMIETHDQAGRPLHGLREIFLAKPAPTDEAQPRIFHLNRAQVNFFLFALVLLDIGLFTMAIFFPERWSETFHGMPYVDPAGLLRRTGGLWVAFTILQAIALFRWQKQPYWLTLIAGVRFTELFSDWITIAVAERMTLMGTLGLLVSPPSNLIFGLILISTYKRLKSGPLPVGSFFAKPWS